jgi:DMSO/TMAO reductase YedYZ heme-binding membrane subunit
MELAITIVVTAVVAVLLAPSIRKAPAVWYAGAVAVCVICAYLTLHPMPYQVLRAFAFAVQKCYVAFGLFAVVMFVGAAPKTSVFFHRVMPARAELSIVATLLSGGHIVLYTMNYLSTGSALFSTPKMLVPFAMSVIAAVVLVVLFVTSFKRVRVTMPFNRWKSIQRFAYLFFALIIVHALLFLGPSALNGSMHAATNLAVYVLVGAAYAVARIARYMSDRKKASKPETLEDLCR